MELILSSVNQTIKYSPLPDMFVTSLDLTMWIISVDKPSSEIVKRLM